jgi:hypothetical protein
MKLSKFTTTVFMSKRLPIIPKDFGAIECPSTENEIIILLTEEDKPSRSYYDTTPIDIWLVIYRGFPVFLWNWTGSPNPWQQGWLQFL